MTDDLTALRERIAGLMGPDREVDLILWDHAGYPHGNYWNGNAWTDVPPFTASIDAALALVERRLTDLDYSLDKDSGKFYVTLESPRGHSPRSMFQAEAATAPLAILLALLSALQAEQTKPAQPKDKERS